MSPEIKLKPPDVRLEEPENSYEKAFYGDGDVVLRAAEEPFEKQEWRELILEGNGAMLYDEGRNAKLATPSENTNRTVRYQFASPERACKWYENALTTINSELELYRLFDVMRRSGVKPQEVGITLKMSKDFSDAWDYLKYAAYSLMSYAKLNQREKVAGQLVNFTGQRGLRGAVRRIWDKIPLGFSGYVDERGGAITQERVSAQLAKLETNEEVRVLDPETAAFTVFSRLYDGTFVSGAKKMSTTELGGLIMQDPFMAAYDVDFEDRQVTALYNSFETRTARMRIGACVRVAEAVYRKTAEDLFQLEEDRGKERAETVRMQTVRSSDLLTWVYQGLKPRPVDFELYEFLSFEQVLSMQELTEAEESETELGRIHERFSGILYLLYPEVVESVRQGTVKVGLLGKLMGKKEQEPCSLLEAVVKHIQSSELKQGNFGDCYLLGALNSAKKMHPRVYFEMLARTIAWDANKNAWRVRFLGADLELLKDVMGDEYDDGWIMVPQEELDSWIEGKLGGKVGVKGNLPDIILERAYASYVNAIENKKKGGTLIGDSRGNMAFEGGSAYKALYDVFGPLVEKRVLGEQVLPFSKSKELSGALLFLSQDFFRKPERYIATTGINGLVTSNKVYRGHTIFSGHAYSLLDCLLRGEITDDPKEAYEVTLENPHDTQEEHFVMKLVDYFMYFGAIDLARFVKKFRDYDKPYRNLEAILRKSKK